MTRRLIIAMVMFMSATAVADGQIVSYLTQLRDPSLNILYIGVSNNVWLKNLPEDCKVKFNDKFISPRDHYAGDSFYIYKNFFLTVEKEGNYVLRVFQQNKEIFKKEYQANRVNDPVVRLGIVKDSFASVEEILAYPAVVCTYPGCLMKRGPYIVYYVVTIRNSENRRAFTIEDRKGLNGVAFGDELKNEIRRMKRGDKITVEEIKGFANGCMTRSFASIKVTIK
jgi:hypothetical protein